MLSHNKNLFLGAAAAAAVWLIAYFMFVRGNWVEAAAKRDDAEAAREEWEKNFEQKKGLMPKTEAKKAIEENEGLLSNNLLKLQRIELGTAQTLHAFTVAAAGQQDPNNYYDGMRIKMIENANNNLHLPVPSLGGGAEVGGADVPVAVKLLRLAVVEAFINACHNAGVKQITYLKYYSPRMIESEEAAPAAAGEDDGTAPAHAAKKAAPDKTAAPAGASRIVQFPIKVSLQAEEKAFNRLLWELQQPTGTGCRYLCLRGFHVTLKDRERGDFVDATVAVSGLLNENLVQELGVKMEGEERPGQSRPRPRGIW
ncbi:MAG: hypothetical protein ABSE73_14630 [Planctomycetota bacterium]